jgi:hypothetical protein
VAQTPVAEATARAVRRWRPGGYDGPVTVLAGDGDGWTPPARTVRHVLPADAGTLLDPPAVDAVAAALAATVDGAGAASTDG